MCGLQRRKWHTRSRALTPALSHPMGEGEVVSALRRNPLLLIRECCCARGSAYAQKLRRDRRTRSAKKSVVGWRGFWALDGVGWASGFALEQIAHEVAGIDEGSAAALHPKHRRDYFEIGLGPDIGKDLIVQIDQGFAVVGVVF